MSWHVLELISHWRNVVKCVWEISYCLLTQMSQPVMISDGKTQIRSVENFLIDLRKYNASWPAKTTCIFNDKKRKISELPHTKKRDGTIRVSMPLLTIPVNNIDTIPERPRPSASMYLVENNEWCEMKIQHRRKSELLEMRIDKSILDLEMSYEK